MIITAMIWAPLKIFHNFYYKYVLVWKSHKAFMVYLENIVWCRLFSVWERLHSINKPWWKMPKDVNEVLNSLQCIIEYLFKDSISNLHDFQENLPILCNSHLRTLKEKHSYQIIKWQITELKLNRPILVVTTYTYTTIKRFLHFYPFFLTF